MMSFSLTIITAAKAKCHLNIITNFYHLLLAQQEEKSQSFGTGAERGDPKLTLMGALFVP